MSRTIENVMDTDLNPTATVGASDNIARMAVEAAEGSATGDTAAAAEGSATGNAGDAGAGDATNEGGTAMETGAQAGRQADFRLSMLGQNMGNKERIASVIGGGALTAYGLRRGSKLGYTLAAAGLGLVARGATGHCPAYGAAHKSTVAEETPPVVEVRQTITVGKPPEEIYRFWRNFENLPKFMDHLESVAVKDEKTSHWVARAPMGRTVSWDAEIVSDEPGTCIGWQSLPGSQIMNSGMVSFREAPGGRGAEIHVHLTYQPPAGQLGRAIATLTGEEPKMQVHNDLLRLKRLLETGEIATTQGQPHGERSLKGRLLSKREG
jgi:uncharacterized membrane protein